MAAGRPEIPTAPQRLASLDAYRGFVMICLAASGFGIPQAAKNFPESSFWQAAALQFEHIPWVGCAFWDLIQPSFMFMVGVALPFSLHRRRAAGDSSIGLWGHACWRALVLVLLGIALSSIGQKQTNFTFVNVLTQIGLGYALLFLIAFWPTWLQWLTAVLILAGYWAWFATYPLPPPNFDYTLVGMPADWPLLTGFEAHWQKNMNAAAAFDVWFMNLFPRPEPFLFNGGGYQTLNFIPSLATMLFGVLAGDFIRRNTNRWKVVGVLVVGGLLGLASGLALNTFDLCPLVKRIWTPSWALYSTGWTVLMLAAFYLVIDIIGLRRWSFPLQVAGMNSIALYIMGQTLRPFTRETLNTHLGSQWVNLFGENYAPIVQSCGILLVFWIFVYWLYRQRVFLKI